MKKIELHGQPSGKCSFFEMYYLEQPPLERLIGTARELGFELVMMDVAEIYSIFSGGPYKSPVIFLRNGEEGTEAVISQRRQGHGTVFSLDYYTMKGE